jgi:hypothetical protein
LITKKLQIIVCQLVANMELKTNSWLRLLDRGRLSDALSGMATATINLRPSADDPARMEYFVQVFGDDIQSQAKSGSYQSLEDVFDIAFKDQLTKAAKLGIKSVLDAGLEARSNLAEDYKASSVMRRVLIASLGRVAQSYQRHVAALQVRTQG